MTDASRRRRVQAVIDGSVTAVGHATQWLNDLNVYPVPDGDTGANLAATLAAVADAVSASDSDEPDELAGVVRTAALMGARGNSGIILSQILRGFCDALGAASQLDAAVLADAFQAASDAAYRAVRQPVEGTILTVVREVAQEAATRRDASVDELCDAVIARAVDALERTPTMLETLREAGVVDAGAAGLVEILRGGVSGLRGQTPLAHTTATAVLSLAAAAPHDGPSQFRYCTNFVVAGVDPSRLERDLTGLGDCLIVVGDERACRAHLHADDPGAAISQATLLGGLVSVEVADMHTQIRQRDARLGAAPAPLRLVREHRRCDVVVVIAGDGNTRIARSLGARQIVHGGATMNPSTQELVAAIDSADADEVVVVPNNPNVFLAALAAADAAAKPCQVVETRSIAAGLTALVAYLPDATAAENAALLRDALRGVVTGELTRAVRTARVDGISIRTGDWIGIVDGRVIAASDTLASVVGSVTDALLADQRQLLTVLTGAGDDAAAACQALEEVTVTHQHVTVEIQGGGQPHYPLLFAAE